MADMRYRLLGATGLRVSELCLGAMIFGDARGTWGADRAEVTAIINRFGEAGGNFIDTANHYAGGESERLVAECRTPAARRIADALNAVADARGVPSSQVALAWVRAQQPRAVIIPIVGVRTDAQLADNLGALDTDLSPAEIARLDEASHVARGFPGDFGGATLAYGRTLDRIVDHRATIDPLV
jgi:aryl-alcohol dehydrogenase-like predicted oxidoreductase